MRGGRGGRLVFGVLATLAIILPACRGSASGGATPRYPRHKSVLQAQVDKLANTPGVPAPTTPVPAPTPKLTVGPVIAGHPDAELSSVASLPAPSPTTLPAVIPPPAPTAVSWSTITPGGSLPASPATGAVAALLRSVDRAPLLRSVLDPLLDAPLAALSAITYRVCAETAHASLACSLPVPIGVPVLVDVAHGLIPDVLATLTPFIPLAVGLTLTPPSVAVGLGGIGVEFDVHRLLPDPLPAHVFAVYQLPGTDQRLEYGYDGRESTLALDSNTLVTIPHLGAGHTSDVELAAAITHLLPGAAESETMAITTPDGTDDTAAVLHMRAVPALISADVHLLHGIAGAGDEDVVSVDTTGLTTVDASLRQDTAGTRQDVTAHVDRLPAHVSVDIERGPDLTNITYAASAPVSLVHVAQRVTPDTTHTDSFTQSDGEVSGVPSLLHVAVRGVSDVEYTASGAIPRVAALIESTRRGAVVREVSAVAHGLPRVVRVHADIAGGRVTYAADANLADLSVGSFTATDSTMVLAASARSVPRQIQVTLGDRGVDYSASGPIGVLAATLSIAGASTIPLPGVDHVTVRQRGKAFGVDARVSGVERAQVDLTGLRSSVTLAPGGQPFQAVADLDGPERVATLAVSNLPPTITVALDPAHGAVTYTAGAVIRAVDAQYSEPAVGQRAHVHVTGVPTRLSLDWPTSDHPSDFRYSADRPVDSVAAEGQLTRGGPAFETELDAVPRFLHVSTSNPMTFEARTSDAPTAAPDHVGSILLRFASDGALRTTNDPNDHLVLDVTHAVRAELLYHGLQSASFDQERSGDVHADITNAAARRFDLSLAAAGGAARGFIDRVPAQMHVDLAGADVHYRGQSTIAELALVATRAGGDQVEADVRDLPTDIDLRLDPGATAVHWTASGPTGEIHAAAHLSQSPPLDVSLALSGLPASWDASFAGGHALLSTAAPIASVEVRISNHGSATALESDGVSVILDDHDHVDGFIRVSNLRSVAYDPVPSSRGQAQGFQVHVEAGTGGAFALHADVQRGAPAVVDGSIIGLPTRMDLVSVDGGIAYTGDRRPDIDLAFRYGDSPPDLPSTRPQGLTVRGGRGGAAGRLYLTGLPTALTIDPAAGVYHLTGFRPTIDTLTIDAQLKDLLPVPITVLATQVIGAGPPVDFTIHNIGSTDDVSGDHVVTADYDSSRPLGAFDADVEVGPHRARLALSEIPRSLHLLATFGKDRKDVSIDLGDRIRSVAALYGRAGEHRWLAGAQLTNLPTHADVTMTPTAKGDAPLFVYRGGASGLGLLAFADIAAFVPDPAAPKAYVQVQATNLASNLTVSRSGRVLALRSSPERTGSFMLVATAEMPPFAFSIPKDARVPVVTVAMTGSVTLDVTELTVGFTGLRSLDVTLNYTTKIAGDYTSFTFGEQSNTTITLDATVSFDRRTLAQVHLDKVALGNVIGYFRMASDPAGQWVRVLNKNVCLTPRPQSTTNGPQLTVFGGVAYATVDPEAMIPDEISDIIAAYIEHQRDGFHRC